MTATAPPPPAFGLELMTAAKLLTQLRYLSEILGAESMLSKTFWTVRNLMEIFVSNSCRFIFVLVSQFVYLPWTFFHAYALLELIKVQ